MTFLHYVQFLLSIFCGEERCAFRVSLIDGVKALYKGFPFFFFFFFSFFFPTRYFSFDVFCKQ